MNPIADYLFQTGTTQSGFAQSIGVTQGMIFQLLRGDRPASEKLCVRIEQATDKALTRQMLRPDDWHLIWPELVQPEAAHD